MMSNEQRYFEIVMMILNYTKKYIFILLLKYIIILHQFYQNFLDKNEYICFFH
jgi:hypothetical protein